jgi:flagella basal body P-ring formation protein FlgA
MLRRFVLTALALLVLPGTAAADAARLRAQVTVSSDYVRLGDLIDGAGALANQAVFRSPDLGTTGTVQATRVAAAAREKGLASLDTQGLAEVTVTRASRTIDLEEIKKVLTLAIVRQNGLDADADLAVVFDQGQRPVHIEPNLTAPLQVTQLNWNPTSGRFDASFGVEGSNILVRTPLRASGGAIETVNVPVYAHALARGDVIRASDVTLDRQPRSNAIIGAVTGPELAIGQAVKRPVRPGQVVASADLTKPDLVARNDTVSLIYSVPGMVLSIRAKALAGGAEGDIVPVLNVQSNRIVQATVAGPGRVTVVAGARTAPN